MKKYLIWDFDGTLGYRIGGWSSSLLEIMTLKAPEVAIELNQIKANTFKGFPWHTPEKPNLPVRSPEQWWEAVNNTFERTFQALGIEDQRCQEMANMVRHSYINPIAWRLFDDTIPTLESLSSSGWNHILLSNHVPELPLIMNHLGIATYFARIFNSAETGYEKPHIRAFLSVLEFVDDYKVIWMIGDRMQTDIIGAELAGIPAILVRKYNKDVKYYCNDLTQIPLIVNN